MEQSKTSAFLIPEETLPKIESNLEKLKQMANIVVLPLYKLKMTAVYSPEELERFGITKSHSVYILTDAGGVFETEIPEFIGVQRVYKKVAHANLVEKIETRSRSLGLI